MSFDLLKAVADFVTNSQVAQGYAPKWYKWSDSDVAGAGNFILYRMAGTAGIRDQFVQRPDVRVLVVVPPTQIQEGNHVADAIFRLFAGIGKPTGVLKLEPLGTVTGPYYLTNGRGVYEIIVRCFVEDH